MGHELTVSVVDSTERLAGLRDEWNRLLEASRARSICTRWEWMYTWWEVYRDCGERPHVIMVHDGSRLVGLAPFYLQIQRKFGLLDIRTLRFLGTGEPEREEVASEYLDIVAQEGYEEPVAQAALKHLLGQKSWDQLLCNDVLEDSLLMTTLRRLMTQDCMPISVEPVGIRYSVDLPRTWDAYLATLDAGAAKRLPYKRRKFERAGRVVVTTVTAPQELEHAFDELIRLHTLRWEARGKPGVFASPRFTAYHKRLARELLPLGKLSMQLLSLEGANIAVLYNLRDEGTDYFYQGGFDVSYAAKYSPGLLAHVYAIEGAIRDGLKLYDFMKGGTVSYKTEFGCMESRMYGMRGFARTLCGKMLWLEIKLWNFLRPIRRKLSHALGENRGDET